MLKACACAGEQGSRGAGEQGSRGAREQGRVQCALFFPLCPSAPLPLCPSAPPHTVFCILTPDLFTHISEAHDYQTEDFHRWGIGNHRLTDLLTSQPTG
ncbi:MAG: hypothetical protein V7L23_07755 [Nostoc sp.]|uniref:hypothetical protein n=1 Tax=Nostoc sp. TaxID=1180 RepID=UPI002FF2AF08